MRIGIFGAEPWTEGMRLEIERRLGIDAVDIYGLSEVMGPGVACEFVETKDGPTVWEDHFYPEIVDPETGAPVPDGEPGELVFTSLTKEAMPVIRYRTRDLTRLMPGSRTAMRRMAKITGRSDDMLIVRGVNLFPSQVEEQILRDPALSGHYVIELSRTGALDDLLVRVEARLEAVHEARTSSARRARRAAEGHVRPVGDDRDRRARRHRTLDGQGAPGDRQAPEGLIPSSSRSKGGVAGAGSAWPILGSCGTIYLVESTGRFHARNSGCQCQNPSSPASRRRGAGGNDCYHPPRPPGSTPDTGYGQSGRACRSSDRPHQGPAQP